MTVRAPIFTASRLRGVFGCTIACGTASKGDETENRKEQVGIVLNQSLVCQVQLCELCF